MKKRLGVKVPIWLSTIKSHESPWIMCVHVASHISLESFWQRLQFYFRPHLNRRYIQEVKDFQNVGSFNFGNFGTPKLGVFEQNDIKVQPPWLIIKNTIRGKVVASPKSGMWWVLWVGVCTWFVRDAFPSSLIDSNMSLKWKQRKSKELGTNSLAHNTLRVEGRVGAPGWN
jgi:hypothetical protein